MFLLKLLLQNYFKFLLVHVFVVNVYVDCHFMYLNIILMQYWDFYECTINTFLGFLYNLKTFDSEGDQQSTKYILKKYIIIVLQIKWSELKFVKQKKIFFVGYYIRSLHVICALHNYVLLICITRRLFLEIYSFYHLLKLQTECFVKYFI